MSLTLRRSKRIAASKKPISAKKSPAADMKMAGTVEISLKFGPPRPRPRSDRTDRKDDLETLRLMEEYEEEIRKMNAKSRKAKLQAENVEAEDDKQVAPQPKIKLFGSPSSWVGNYSLGHGILRPASLCGPDHRSDCHPSRQVRQPTATRRPSVVIENDILKPKDKNARLEAGKKRRFALEHEEVEFSKIAKTCKGSNAPARPTKVKNNGAGRAIRKFEELSIH
ncbi:uncharacterized protein RAG0_06279 [Rhynchosporium agropyri]|uniref:Uncharacterized protein n=1 Tax=Rhynchosporium agropyri TaxID=914238 RepID=A0A1E1KGP3_9HELO|nr:uncharacterized protein RAG0_06279 [Rhynchosporium agropyri]